MEWVNDIKIILEGSESVNLLKDRNLSLQKQVDTITKDNAQLKDQMEKLKVRIEALEKAPPTVIVKKVAVVRQVGELKSSGSGSNLAGLVESHSPTTSPPNIFQDDTVPSCNSSVPPPPLEALNNGSVVPPQASSVVPSPPIGSSSVPLPPMTISSSVPPPPVGFNSAVPPSSSIPLPPVMGTVPPNSAIPLPPGMNSSVPMPPGIPVPPGIEMPVVGSTVPPPVGTPGMGGIVPPPPFSNVPMPPGFGGVPPPPGMNGTVPMPPLSGVPLPPGMNGSVPVPPLGVGMPPPPMFGFVQTPPVIASAPKLPDIPKKKASVPTKDVRLNKLDNNKLQKSVWMKKNIHAKLFDIDIPEKELEDMFAQISKSPSVGLTPEKSEKPKDTTISLLEGPRLQNVSIFMKYLKMPSTQLVEKIMTISDDFNEESIGKLLNQVPNEDEIQRQNDFDGDEATLNEADKFIRAMMKVPRLASRLKCWNFKLKYVETKACINPDLETIISTCASLVESEKLQELFAVILAFSNYLSKTGIHGFKLNSLQKLKETKGNAKNITLLDMIVKHITSAKPDILKVKEDLNMLERAARVEMQTLADKIDSMEKSIALLKIEIQYYSKNPQPNDRFLEVFGSFLNECEDEMKLIKEKQQNMDNQISGVAEFLGEDPNTVKKEPKEIFLMLNSFINDLYKSVDNLKKEEEKRKKEESKLAKEKDNRPSSPVVTVGGLKAFNSFRTPSKVPLIAENADVSVTPSSPVTPIIISLPDIEPSVEITSPSTPIQEKQNEPTIELTKNGHDLLSPSMQMGNSLEENSPSRRSGHIRNPSILMSLEKSLYEGSALLSPSTKTRKRGGGMMTGLDMNELSAALNKKK